VSYQIKKEGIQIASFTLFKEKVKIGENVQGHLDFSEAQIPTYHVSVTLEQSEKIFPQWAEKNPETIKAISKRVCDFSFSFFSLDP